MNLMQVERLLRDHGLRLLRQESSHYIYGDDHGGRLVVAAHHQPKRALSANPTSNVPAM
jgi:predicted RNA binding protein YcfA (HicA-like mRNA interferase family)